MKALRKSSLIDLHRQNEVVQEAGAFLCFWVMNEPLIILTGAFCLILFRSCPGHRFRQLLRPAFLCGVTGYDTLFYNGEFDPGSG